MRLTTASTRCQSLAMINLSNHLTTETEDSDDDSSTSSTIAVATSLLKAVNAAAGYPPLPQNNNAPLVAAKNKKTVRFNEHDNKSYINTVLCKEDCQEFWYNAKDYAHFKSSTKFMVKEIARLEKHNKKSTNSYRRVLERTYQASVVSNINNSIVVEDIDDAKQLEEWMRVSTCRLGLERLAIRSIAMDRSQRRADLVDVVLELQHQQQQHSRTGGANNNNKTVDVDAATESLRQASEELSRTSRLFAQHLAVALQNSYNLYTIKVI